MCRKKLSIVFSTGKKVKPFRSSWPQPWLVAKILILYRISLLLCMYDKYPIHDNRASVLLYCRPNTQICFQNLPFLPGKKIKIKINNPYIKPERGDLIQIFRPGYQHWAVYIGDDFVVHLAPLCE